MEQPEECGLLLLKAFGTRFRLGEHSYCYCYWPQRRQARASCGATEKKKKNNEILLHENDRAVHKELRELQERRKQKTVHFIAVLKF